MDNLSIALVQLIEAVEPSLKNKVQPGMVSSETKTPFAAYSEPTEEPRRTKDGIVGMRTVFTMAIYHNNKVAASQLKDSLIYKLDRKDVVGRRIIFISAEYDFYEDNKLHGYILTFNIK